MSKLYNSWTALAAKAIAVLSPAAASRYAYGREVFREYVAGNATGADRGFRPRNRTMESDIRKGGALISARCRDQYQNNPYIVGMVERTISNVVRSGIVSKFNVLSGDGKPSQPLNTQLNALYTPWARRHCDLAGHDSMGYIQKMMLRHQWVDAGILIHRVIDTTAPAGVVPLKLELIETAQLDPLIDGTLDNGNIARRGIEMDANGKPVAYHVLDAHPGDYLAGGSRRSSRISAADIYHVYDRRFASQWSGVSWLAAIVMEAYKMHDYRDIEMDGARTAAAFVAFAKTNIPGFQLGMSPGGQATPGGGAGDTVEGDRPTEIRSNMIQYLPNGTDVTLASHARPGASYEPFVKDSLRSQSAGGGMSFEAFSNNYSDSTYASARSGSVEERLGYKGQQRFLIEKPLDRINGWFLDAAVLAGLIRIPDYLARREQILDQIIYEAPGWQWVDPRNDAQANEIKLEQGSTSHQKLAAEAGTSFEENLREQIEAYALMAERDALRPVAVAVDDAVAEDDEQ